MKSSLRILAFRAETESLTDAKLWAGNNNSTEKNQIESE